MRRRDGNNMSPPYDPLLKLGDLKRILAELSRRADVVMIVLRDVTGNFAFKPREGAPLEDTQL